MKTSLTTGKHLRPRFYVTGHFSQILLSLIHISQVSLYTPSHILCYALFSDFTPHTFLRNHFKHFSATHLLDITFHTFFKYNFRYRVTHFFHISFYTLFSYIILHTFFIYQFTHFFQISLERIYLKKNIVAKCGWMYKN